MKTLKLDRISEKQLALSIYFKRNCFKLFICPMCTAAWETILSTTSWLVKSTALYWRGKLTRHLANQPIHPNPWSNFSCKTETVFKGSCSWSSLQSWFITALLGSTGGMIGKNCSCSRPENITLTLENKQATTGKVVLSRQYILVLREKTQRWRPSGWLCKCFMANFLTSQPNRASNVETA